MCNIRLLYLRIELEEEIHIIQLYVPVKDKKDEKNGTIFQKITRIYSLLRGNFFSNNHGGQVLDDEKQLKQ